MQIVIDIPEDVVECAKSSPNYYPTYHFEEIWRAIIDGIPLPKRHGRLIDADKLHNCECKGNFSECDTCLDDDLCNLVNEAPTIIEADKGSEV